MTLPTWPVGLPFINHLGTYRETGPQGALLATPMDAGPSKSRRRFTAALRAVSGQTDIMTDAQIDTFEDWYEDDIGGGALAFTAVNPRTGVTQTYKFTPKGYDLIYIDTDKQRVSADLVQQP